MPKKPGRTLDQLHGNTKKHFPKRFGAARKAMPRVPRLTYTPFIGMKTLVVRADVQGEAENKKYKVIMVFQKVDYSQKRDKTHTVDVKVNGDTWYMKPLTVKSKVQVRCSCKDFYFTFGYWDWTVGAIYGIKPKPYTRKTTTYPERNPAHAPGICKHLIAVMNKVKRSKYWKK